MQPTLAFGLRSKLIDVVSLIMLGWMIATLACLCYFLYEAQRAPIIEDHEADDAE